MVCLTDSCLLENNALLIWHGVHSEASGPNAVLRSAFIGSQASCRGDTLHYCPTRNGSNAEKHFLHRDK